MEELRKITSEELKTILAEHEKWLKSKCEEGMRADLSAIDLREANLSMAILREANLVRADLGGANLKGADLRSADMRKANLNKASLYKAVLRKANLTGAILTNTDLHGSDLSHAKYFIPSVCPEEGSFIAWKKAMTPASNDYVIIKLLIPEDALRSSGTSRKCRASKAKVLDIQTLEGVSLKDIIAYSWFSDSFAYVIGKTIIPGAFDRNRFNECSHGIHFFMSRCEAVNYEF